MKMTNSIKKALLKVIFFTTIALIASCTNTQNTKDTKDVAEDHNDAKFGNRNQERDAQFLVNAAEINLEEIQLGQLAQKRGRTDHVKELGKMMEDSHTKSQKDLIKLANSKNVTIPNSPTNDAQDAYKDLNEKSAKDFDKAYADMTVKGHKDAISTYENASTDSDDTEIRNWAKNALPNLRTHLDHSLECQKHSEKM